MRLLSFIGAEAPLGLARVSELVSNKKVLDFKISQDLHVNDIHMSRVTE